MIPFFVGLWANPIIRKLAIGAALIAVLHVAHCQHDRKLIRDYEAGVQARIKKAVSDATIEADNAAETRFEGFEAGQDDIREAVEGQGDTPAGTATETYHEALRRLQEGV